MFFSPAVCIDQYTELRVKTFEGTLEEGKIDHRLEAIVMRMFERCLADKRYKQAIGISFETRRIDVLERALRESVRIDPRLEHSYLLFQEIIVTHLGCYNLSLSGCLKSLKIPWL